jgi:hypothetical protein
VSSLPKNTAPPGNLYLLAGITLFLVTFLTAFRVARRSDSFF